MNGYNQLPGDKIRVELFFVSAWRAWTHRAVLPSADRSIAGPRKDWDVIRIITDLDKDKKQPYVPFHWDDRAPDGPTIVVREAADFDPANVADANFFAGNISDKIPASAWQHLAQSFIEKYV